MRWHLLLPDLAEMLDLLARNPAYFLSNWWDTLSVALLASALALVISLTTSLLALRFPWLGRLFVPFVAMSQSFPLQAIAPLLIVALGIGFKAKLAIAFIIAFFPIYGSCTASLLATPRPLLAHAAICNAPFSATFWQIRLPAALPAIAAAAKVGFTLSVLGTVVAEFISPTSGLGHILLIAQSDYNVDLIYLCVFMLMIQGTAIYTTLSLLEHRLLAVRRFD